MSCTNSQPIQSPASDWDYDGVRTKGRERRREAVYFGSPRRNHGTVNKNPDRRRDALPRVEETRSQRARDLVHRQERARAMAPEQNASAELGASGKAVSSNGAARVGKGQGSMSTTKFQGAAGYVTRMSGGVRGMDQKASSYPGYVSFSRVISLWPA